MNTPKETFTRWQTGGANNWEIQQPTPGGRIIIIARCTSGHARQIVAEHNDKPELAAALETLSSFCRIALSKGILIDSMACDDIRNGTLGAEALLARVKGEA